MADTLGISRSLIEADGQIYGKADEERGFCATQLRVDYTILSKFLI